MGPRQGVGTNQYRSRGPSRLAVTPGTRPLLNQAQPAPGPRRAVISPTLGARASQPGRPAANSGFDRDPVRLYLDAIGRYPLLTRQQEEQLAEKILAGQAGKRRLAQPGPLGTDDRRQLHRDVRRGELAAEQLVQSNLRLVVSIAKRYRGSGMPLLDLVQEGNLGLIRAADKFDGRRGLRFSTCATWWIKQAVTRSIANTSKTIRVPVHARNQSSQALRAQAQLESRLGREPTVAELAERLGIPQDQVARRLRQNNEPLSLDATAGPDGEPELSSLIADTGTPSPLDTAVQETVNSEINRALETCLGQREQQVLRMRYGLDREGPRTLEQIGSTMHLTRERVRQIESLALSRLRQPDVAHLKGLLTS